MKKTLLFLFVVISVITQAQPMPAANRYYQPYIDYNNTGLRLSITSYEKHTAMVLSYNGANVNVDVPEQFEYEGDTFTVTSINDYAFWNKCSMRQVTLPATIERIGSYAFFDSKTTIPNLPDSLRYVGEHAFSGTRNYVFTIPAKMKDIVPSAFSQNGLDFFYVDSLNPYYTAVDGVLYTKDTSTLVACPNNKIGTFVVPEGVRRIEAYAFSWTCLFTEIVLPNSLREIGRRAIELSGTTPIHIPAEVCRIEGNPVFNRPVILDSLDGVPNQHYRFEGDRLVSMDGDTLILWNNASGEITVPQGIKVIADECFANYEDIITRVNLPEGITTLGINSLQGSLFKSNMPSTVRHIKEYACEGVEFDSIILPEGIIEIGSGAFAGAVVNTFVRFPSSLKCISDSMFLQSKVNRFEFSEGLEEIGINAFALIRGMNSHSYRFPYTLRRICNGAFGLSGFHDCVFTGELDTIGAQLGGSTISSCRLANNVPPMLYPGFFGSNNLQQIVVPCGMVPVYQAASGEWDKIADSLFVENCESIATVEENSTYLMPNPASETVTVASSFRIAEVELFSLDGRSLLRSKVDAMSTALNLDALAAGTYIVRIATNGGTAYKKLVVK